MEQMQLYAGLDMHTETITGIIKDDAGNPVRVLKVETSEEGVKKLFERFKKTQGLQPRQANQARGGNMTKFFPKKWQPPPRRQKRNLPIAKGGLPSTTRGCNRSL